MSEHYCQHRRLKANCPSCSVERAVAELRGELEQLGSTTVALGQNRGRLA